MTGLSKKYFSIAEASEATKLPSHKLRYIEKNDPKISITKIRDRRYYTQKDIEYLKRYYSDIKEVTSQTLPQSTITAAADDHSEVIARIDALLQSLRGIAGVSGG